MSRLRSARRQRVVVHREPAADVGQAVLLGAHRHAVGQAEDLAGDVATAALALARLALVDEPRVLGEATGVEEQRHAVAAQIGARARRFSRDTGWPPPSCW
jgi:hypothetical protein